MNTLVKCNFLSFLEFSFFSKLSIFAFLLLYLVEVRAEAQTGSQTEIAQAKNEKNQTKINAQQWMKSFSGNLNTLILPGTHDSGARFGGIYAECQTLTITEQLEAGVRFLDLRVRHLNDDFAIYHGIMDQRLKFSAALKSCQAFLNKNPSECVLISIKEEGKPKENTRTFFKTYQSLIQPHSKRWYAKKTMPELDQVRGKIVVISRNRHIQGIPWRELAVQDQFKVSGNKAMHKKWRIFKKHFEKSQQLPKNKQAAVHFATGNGVFSPPLILARFINPLLENYLNKNQELIKHRKLRGIVVLDFPSQDLIHSLIQSNLP